MLKGVIHNQTAFNIGLAAAGAGWLNFDGQHLFGNIFFIFRQSFCQLGICRLIMQFNAVGNIEILVLAQSLD